ncbi:MAG: hypothetical protein JST92_26130, partial [Deltaproteobacteria bacterium]|nr:hypothetical protein [Deltaproteobacteria bacterium]
VGHVLTTPSDTEIGTPKIPQAAQKWQISEWIASDVTVRYGLFDRLQVEGQLKLTNPVDPFTPELIGGAFGARVLLLKPAEPGRFALEIGGRFVGVRASQEVTQTSGTRSQTDDWTYRALGFEVPLIASLKVHPLVTLTGAPFARAYFIRAWHDTVAFDGTVSHERLEWTPVLTGGAGFSAQILMGPVEISPAVAFELATRPGNNAPTQLLIEPGVNLGMRW